MQRLFRILIITSTLTSLLSCNEPTKKAEKSKAKVESPAIGSPLIKPEHITSSFPQFWSYYTENIDLFEDFVPLDTLGSIISKRDFLSEMGTGKYYPLLVYAGDSSIGYRLKPIPENASQSIGSYMKQFSKEELAFYELEGKPVPAFDFQDINGQRFNSKNTIGKIVLFKCWFISCVACVAEMPELNKMVDKYKDRDDILFISLAMDESGPLQAFLKKTKFDYLTIPRQTKYMEEGLKVRTYPTHFIINKQGIMVKAVSEAHDIETLLARELAK